MRTNMLAHQWPYMVILQIYLIILAGSPTVILGNKKQINKIETKENVPEVRECTCYYLLLNQHVGIKSRIAVFLVSFLVIFQIF